MDTVMIGLRVLLSLGAVLALLWWLHRKLSTGPRAAKVNPVSVVAKQGIGSKASIVVIDVEGSRLVLGVTEQSVSVLQSGDAPAPEVVPAAAAFGRSMDAALKGGSMMPSPMPQFGQKGSLAGSILSMDTWRQAATTIRGVR